MKGQIDDLKTLVDRTQVKALQMSKPSILLSKKKTKCMAIKREKASSEEVMAIMGIGLERMKPVEVPTKICLHERRP